MEKFEKIRVGIILGILLLPLVFFLKPAMSDSRNETISQWLDRVELSTEVQTDKKPTFYFQTVQPLYQDDFKTNTVFIQPRISMRDERAMYNLGFGYRRLVSDNLILGVNTFGDYQEQSRHGRVGVGLEALGQILETRLNSYFGGISSKSNIVETAAGSTIERVADGVDLEFGVPLPYMPWLKLYGSGFWYDFKESSDDFGWKTRAEARINDYTRLEVFTLDDNKGDRELGGRLRFNIAFNSWTDILAGLKFSDQAFPNKDMTKELLIPVERHHDIVVEKYTKSKGLTVEAGRGSL
jgi:hypothetical protein